MRDTMAHHSHAHLVAYSDVMICKFVRQLPLELHQSNLVAGIVNDWLFLVTLLHEAQGFIF